ncbi:MAG: ATP-binding cassette domain-containing protein [Lamprobacter sp.]|uniref:ABC transporter ATP-binding protein n=1 Tax=Lamprobacter sp. TaxID=3100796 RepID=UPI002B258875|nr:ATP-binding cassette domain-containing protein [Lamprobacter sp.]MEA3640169.1 ATP-binding cassette domain-containing protein [Lamprobacter sp.]
MIEAHEISRRYGTLTAVDRVSFMIGRREIVGLLGQNGAGKTTIMKMLTGFLEPSAGQIVIDQLDLASRRREVQRRIGYLPENCPLYPDLSVLEHLDYQATLHRIPLRHRADAIRRAIERTELGNKAQATVATLSRGYRQRLGVAQAILHEPQILILDEPTNGLDPSQIQHMRALIRELARQATVIISTHVLQEVEALCSRVLIMRAGQLAIDSRLDALSTDPRLLVTLDRPLSEVNEILGAIETVGAVTHLGDEGARRRFALQTADPKRLAPRVAQIAAERGWALYALTPERQDLEALFRAVASGEQIQAAESRSAPSAAANSVPTPDSTRDSGSDLSARPANAKATTTTRKKRPQTKARPKPQAKRELKPQAKAKPAPRVKLGPKPASQSKAKAAPKPTPKSKAKVKAAPKPRSASSAKEGPTHD